MIIKGLGIFMSFDVTLDELENLVKDRFSTFIESLHLEAYEHSATKEKYARLTNCLKELEQRKKLIDLGQIDHQEEEVLYFSKQPSSTTSKGTK